MNASSGKKLIEELKAVKCMKKDRIKVICKKSYLINRVIAITYRILGMTLFPRGKGNRLVAPCAFLWRVKFNIRGRSNTVVFERGVRIKNTHIGIYGNNNTLIIMKYARIHNSEFVLDKGDCIICIGMESSAEKALFAAVEQESQITIGTDCMLSTDVEIRTSDSHKILDDEGNRVNFKGDIVVEDHVWIGAHASILKGVTLGSGSIIGFGSVVTKNIPANSIAAGNPAKIVKEKIWWER